MPTVNGNCIRVAARQLLNGTDEIVNVFHFTVSVAGTNGDQGILDEAAAKLSNAWVELAGILPNDLAPNIVDVYNVTQDYPLGSTAWEGAYTGGTSSGEYLPPQVSLLVLWNTSVKRVQGKTYLGPIVETVHADGVFTGTAITAASDWAGQMRDVVALVDDTELALCVYSSAGGNQRAIVSRRVVSIPATLRRRRPGRGS